jgi:hypothetical protein
MLRGELHNRGSAGRCEACGEIFPCPTGLAIYEAVKREIENPTPPRPQPGAVPPPPIQQPTPVRWEDLGDRESPSELSALVGPATALSRPRRLPDDRERHG